MSIVGVAFVGSCLAALPMAQMCLESPLSSASVFSLQSTTRGPVRKPEGLEVQSGEKVKLYSRGPALVAFSHKGEKLATWGLDGVRVNSWRDWKSQISLRLGPGLCQFSDDGTRLLIGPTSAMISATQTGAVVDVESGRILGTFRDPGYVAELRSVDWCGGTAFITLNYEGLSFWSLESERQPPNTIKLVRRINGKFVSFAGLRDGKSVLAAGWDGCIWRYSAPTWDRPSVVYKDEKGENSETVGLLFAGAKGDVVFSCGERKVLRLTNYWVPTIVGELPRNYEFRDVCVSDDCNVLAALTVERKESLELGKWALRVWDLRSKACASRELSGDRIASISMSGDGKVLAAGDEAGHVSIWRISR
jgi:WD40 repeat protein